MAIFSDIELEWEGKVWKVRSTRVMKMIAAIEDHITLPELQQFAARGTVPPAKLCMAYATALRYAGAQHVTDDLVYDTIFSGEDGQATVMMAIMGLMQMMLPPSARAKMNAANEDPEGPEAAELAAAAEVGNSKATVAASSPKPTRQRSQKVNG
jgi:hypothetical protein